MAFGKRKTIARSNVTFLEAAELKPGLKVIWHRAGQEDRAEVLAINRDGKVRLKVDGWLGTTWEKSPILEAQAIS